MEIEIPLKESREESPVHVIPSEKLVISEKPEEKPEIRKEWNMEKWDR